MEAKFTKGEWYEDNRAIRSNIDNGTMIAKVCAFVEAYRSESEANAKLIAAAPETYDLLDWMIKTNGFVHEEDKQHAIALLTKINS